MTTKSILRVGDPLLRRVAEPVADPTGPAIRELIADMEAALADAGGIGLAAPQIGVLQRVLILRVPDVRILEQLQRPVHGGDADSRIDLGGAPMDLDHVRVVARVRKHAGDETALGWEGCLSIPGLRGEVPRYVRLRVTATTPDGDAFEAVVGGTRARVLQHEVDHLDGVLYLDRMTDFTRFGFTEEVLEAEAERRREGLT